MGRPATSAARGVAVFDLDGTLTRHDTYRAFLLRVLPHRVHRLPRMVWLLPAVAVYGVGFRDNSWLKTRFLDAFLGGIRYSDLVPLANRFVTQVVTSALRPRARAAMEQHRQSGDYLILATASFDFYVKEIGQALGFDLVLCTESLWESDRLQPCLPSGNCYGTVKRDRVREATRLMSDAGTVTVYTDSHADLPLLELADRPVVVNPGGRLRRIAADRCYRVVDWGG